MLRPIVAAVALCILASPGFTQDSDRDKKLQEQVDALAKEVATTLGVELRKSIPAAYQSKDDFGKMLTEQLDKELPKEKRDAYTLYYRLLGLVPEDFDFAKTITDTMKSQAGAYYNPETKKMYVLAGDLNPMMLDGVLFHELVHAVQDQEHDLAKAMKALEKDSDAGTGYKFLVEGEASYWMQMRMAKGQPPAALDMAFGMMKNTTTKSILQMMDMQAAMMGDQMPSLKESAAQLKKVPPILIRSLVDPYLRGMYASWKLQKARGKEGFRTLFKEGMAWNSRDFLFSDEWMKSPRGVATVKPAGLDGPLGAGWKMSLEDTLGALTLHTLFEDQKAVADAVAKGWDGDRVQLWTKGGDAVLAGIIAFASEEAAGSAAKQLERLYREQWTKGAQIEEKDGALVAGGKDCFFAESKGSTLAFARGSAPAASKALRDALWKFEVKQAEPVKK